MIVKLIVDGGDMKAGPAVAQQLGPMGINLGKVTADVNKETAGFKGIKVPVELDVNPKTKDYKIKVLSPPTSELIKKELGLEKGSGDAGSVKAGNISFEKNIEAGVYDNEIKNEVTEASPEKEKGLKEYFEDLKSVQDKKQKALAEAKAAEEAAKAAAATTAPAPGITAAGTSAPAAAKEEAKPAAKKK